MTGNITAIKIQWLFKIPKKKNIKDTLAISFIWFFKSLKLITLGNIKTPSVKTILKPTVSPPALEIPFIIDMKSPVMDNTKAKSHKINKYRLILRNSLISRNGTAIAAKKEGDIDRDPSENELFSVGKNNCTQPDWKEINELLEDKTVLSLRTIDGINNKNNVTKSIFL